MTPPTHTALRDPAIEASWQRCRAFGLCADEGPRPTPKEDISVHERLVRSETLLRGAQPVLSEMARHLAGCACVLALADADCVVLATRRTTAWRSNANDAAPRIGALWSERAMGTNAIGTARAEGRLVTVVAGQHYLACNRALHAAAMPLLWLDGSVAGVLCLTSPSALGRAEVAALLGTWAELIEHRLAALTNAGYLSVRFAETIDTLDTPFEAIACFDPDGRLAGSNRPARRWLGDKSETGAATFDALFSPGWRQLPLQADEATLLSLSGADGVRHTVVARLHRRVGNTNAAPLHVADPVMARVLDRMRRIRDRGIPLLIQGETGTGKEWLARTFHEESARRNQPFVCVNCAAIPASLIESELFGCAPGTCSGAAAEGSQGKLAEADGGTLFLDEIGDMPLALQAVLLRALETRRITPVGGQQERPLDIALVCASHRPLKALVERGEFRADLLFRISGLTLTLPPLRERADLEALIAQILREEAGPREVRLRADAAEHLRSYRWPGNLRELRNTLRVAVALLDEGASELTPAHLPRDTTLVDDGPRAEPEMPASGRLRVEEHRLVRECVERHSGNISAAARELGITRSTLYRKLRTVPSVVHDPAAR